MPKAKPTNLCPWQELAHIAIDNMIRRDLQWEKFTAAVGRTADAIEALKTTLREQASTYSQMDPQQRASFDVIRSLFKQAEVERSVELSLKLHRLESKMSQAPAARNGGVKEEAKV